MMLEAAGLRKKPRRTPLAHRHQLDHPVAVRQTGRAGAMRSDQRRRVEWRRCRCWRGNATLIRPKLRQQIAQIDAGQRWRQIDRPDQIAERRFRCDHRSEEHTSELQSLMRISYAVFCLKNKKNRETTPKTKTNDN